MDYTQTGKGTKSFLEHFKYTCILSKTSLKQDVLKKSFATLLDETFNSPIKHTQNYSYGSLGAFSPEVGDKGAQLRPLKNEAVLMQQQKIREDFEQIMSKIVD